MTEQQLGLVDLSRDHHLVGTRLLVLVMSAVSLVLALVHHRLDNLDHCLSRSVERSGLQLPVLGSNRRLREVVGPNKVSIVGFHIYYGRVVVYLYCRFASDATVLRNQLVFSRHGCCHECRILRGLSAKIWYDFLRSRKFW